MCLGIPVKIVKKNGLQAETEVDGVRRAANLTMLPAAKLGDYVLLHAGFAIEVLDQKEAAIRLKLLRQMMAGNK